MRIRNLVETGLGGMGIVGAIAGASEILSQRQVISELQADRLALQNRACRQENILMGHEYVLRRMAGIDTNRPEMTDCDAQYPVNGMVDTGPLPNFGGKTN